MLEYLTVIDVKYRMMDPGKIILKYLTLHMHTNINDSTYKHIDYIDLPDTKEVSFQTQ